MTSTWGHDEDPARDFQAEVEGIREAFSSGPSGRRARELLRRIAKAASYVVGDDGGALVAKYDLASIRSTLVADDPRLARTAADIVGEVEALAAVLARQRGGPPASPGHRFRSADPRDARSASLWRDAVEIYELLTATEVADAVEEVDGG